MGMKQKNVVVSLNSKWPTSKQLSLSTSLKTEQFPPKFHGLVLELIELIDAKGIDVAKHSAKKSEMNWQPMRGMAALAIAWLPYNGCPSILRSVALVHRFLRSCYSL